MSTNNEDKIALLNKTIFFFQGDVATKNELIKIQKAQIKTLKENH